MNKDKNIIRHTCVDMTTSNDYVKIMQEESTIEMIVDAINIDIKNLEAEENNLQLRINLGDIINNILLNKIILILFKEKQSVKCSISILDKDIEPNDRLFLECFLSTIITDNIEYRVDEKSPCLSVA